MKEDNKFLIRGEGKHKASIKKASFYTFYKQNAKNPVAVKVYNAFTKDLLEAFSDAIVRLGLELRIPSVGKVRVRSNNLHFFKKDGTRSRKLKVNWAATWEYWHKKYPELTRAEIVEIKNKTVLYHENEHSQQEFYEHYWDKLTIPLKYKSFFRFKASRQYSRLIAEVVKDPNRQVFYYG
jgi:hypothetical protein